MWEKIAKLLLKKSDDLVGIDLGTEFIKLVEIAWKKGKPVLKNFGIIDLPENTVEDGRVVNSQQLISVLQKLLATTHTDSKNAVVAVGGRVIFARELSFPKMTEAELHESLKWDLAKHIPYAPGSYYYDSAIVTQSDTETKVLLVASPLDNVNNLVNVIKAVGLIPVAVDLEPLAVHRIFDEAEKAMVVDIGARISQVTVFQNGSPSVIRNIPIGGQNFTQIIMQMLDVDVHEAEQIKQNTLIVAQPDIDVEYINLKRHMEMLVAELAKDINRTADYYKQQNFSARIDKVLITGGGAKLGNLMQHLSTLLDMPAIIHDPLSRLIIPAAFDKTHLKQIAPQLGTAIGLALRGGDR